MQRHFNDYWTISFYNKRKYFICSKWSKTKKYLGTEFKTNCLGLCWVWWRGTATQKFPLLPSPSTRSPFPSVGQRLTSFSSLFLLYFFSNSSHPSSDVGASCRASAGARPSPRAPRISRTSWWWSTSPGGLANTNYLYIYLQHLHPFASLPLASSWTWSLVAGMSRRWWSAWEAVWKKLRLSSWLSSWIILIPQLISFPYKTYNANLFQSLAVTNGHHDSKEDMDMKDDNNQEVTHP